MPTENEQIKSLIEHNDELENYFRNTIIPQLFIDGDMILRKFTPPAMKQFSLSATDVGKSISDIKDNFRFPAIIDNIQHVFDSNEILEKEIQTTDLRWFQMNIIPYVQQSDNRTNGVIITFVEITARIKDLKEQEKLIADHETLLDTISHDIKNPLTNLVLAIDQFKDMTAAKQEEFKPLLEIIERALIKMKDIINELTTTREQEYKYKANVELLSFEHILEDVRLLLHDDIRTSGAVIKSEVIASEIIFSRRKLRSILYNLVNNSIKYRSPDRAPEIFIKTERDNAYIIITVKDNGIGIDPAKHTAIFSKYYRLDNAIEGSGIGLYLVKEIVTNAGGRIELESHLDKGTEIKVFLKGE